MVDLEKQVVFWRDGAKEDWDVARELVQRGRVRHGMFFAHLALEKSLKAHVCRATRDIAPRLHNLVRLAEITGLSMNQDLLDVCAVMNAFQVEGRYPETLSPEPSPEEARRYLSRAQEVFSWLMDRL